MSNQDPSQAPDPNGGEETPRKRGIRDLLGRSTVKAATGNPEPETKETKKGFSLEALVNGLKQTKGRYLSKEGQSEKKVHVADGYLAQTTLKDGSREALSRLLFVGDSVLGLTATFGQDDKLVTTRLIALPLGINENDASGRNNGSARVIASFGTADAQAEFEKTGVRKEWTKLTVGREQIKGDQGVEDTAASRQHLDITLGTNGSVDLKDTSTNGTGILSMDDLMTKTPGVGLDETTYMHAQVLQSRLEARPALWSSDFADQYVVHQ